MSEQVPTNQVVWLSPSVRKGVVHWDHPCEAVVTTPQTVDWRKHHGKSMKCDLHAKIDFRGSKLCTRHASLRALGELAGPMPELQP